MSLFRKVRILEVNPIEPEKEAIDIAAEIIRNGGLVAFPTETVYGLAANLSNSKTIERLYNIKKRAANKPLTIHVADIDAVKRIVTEIPPVADKLIKKFWPGPLTIVLNSKMGRKVGFRMPSNKIARELIKASGVPLVAPSANLAGNRPPCNMQQVIENLGDDIDMIIDGGQTEVGIESTVVDASAFPIDILREKAITKEQLEAAWREDDQGKEENQEHTLCLHG